MGGFLISCVSSFVTQPLVLSERAISFAWRPVYRWTKGVSSLEAMWVSFIVTAGQPVALLFDLKSPFTQHDGLEISSA